MRNHEGSFDLCEDIEFCSICEGYNKTASIMVSAFHPPAECPFWKSKKGARITNNRVTRGQEKRLDRALREVAEKFPLK